MFTACVYRCASAARSGRRAHPLLCWQQRLLGEKVMALTPRTEPKDSNYPLQTALSFVLCLTLPLTQKHQKEGPGSPRLMVQCCKSSRARIFSLFCDITVQFWNLYLQTLVSVKHLCLALWGKETEKGCKAVWIDFFFWSWRKIVWAIYAALLNISRSAGFEGEMEMKCILL